MNVRTGMTLLGAAAGIALLVLVREVFLLTFLGILLATVMSFPTNLMSRVMPRGLAVVLVLLLGAGFFAGVGYLAVTPMAEEMSQLSERVPEGVSRLQRWFVRTEQSTGMGKVAGGDKSPSQDIKERVGKVAEGLWSMAGAAATSLSSAISGLIIIIVLGAFFVHEPEAYRKTLASFLPRHHEDTFSELWSRLGGVLRGWMGGILVSMTIMGTVTAVGLLIAGVQDWLILGFLTFLGTFTPYVGAIASAVPGLLLALGQSTQHFLGALIVYGLVHLIEGYIVEPMVMKRAVVIHPASMLIWQVAMGSLFGILGIMVATPLLACLKEVIGYLYMERQLGKKLEAI